ncbi:hypothetical protein [Sorangium sp. So ce693]|uniref:hypothetical protein n=1 Tax=Sorangium sp. So ce693 TaxID=3133318 RepID=UPI003F607529
MARRAHAAPLLSAPAPCTPHRRQAPSWPTRAALAREVITAAVHELDLVDVDAGDATAPASPAPTSALRPWCLLRRHVQRQRVRELAGVHLDARGRSAGRGAEPALEELAGGGPELDLVDGGGPELDLVDGGGPELDLVDGDGPEPRAALLPGGYDPLPRSEPPEFTQARTATAFAASSLLAARPSSDSRGQDVKAEGEAG